MKTSSILKTLLITGTILTAVPAFAGDDVESIVKEGKFFGEARYRYEYVDQDGPAPITNNAHASTLRANLGFKTGEYKDFQALLEAQFVGNIGANDFNDSVNGKTTYLFSSTVWRNGSIFWSSEKYSQALK